MKGQDFREAAEKAFSEEQESNMSYWPELKPDSEEIEYWKSIYQKGCEHGYSEAKKEGREKENLKQRSDVITILEQYSQFLEDRGYLDTDWRAEAPYAIDEFIKTNKP